MKPEPIIRKLKNGNPLRDLLVKACPSSSRFGTNPVDGTPLFKRDPYGAKSITILAYWLSVTPWAIHKYMKTDKVPAGRAKEITELSNGEVKLSDFNEWVYK